MVTYANHKHKSIRIERLLPFGAIFFSIRNGCEIWYNKRMANKNTTKTRRRPSKAELERKQAIQRMLISLGIALLLIIAAPQTRCSRCHSLQSHSTGGRKFGPMWP